jgi:hypothetical protein
MALYTQNREQPTFYSVRIGDFNIGRARNLHWLTPNEALILKTTPLPHPIIQTEWVNLTDFDHEKMKKRLLPPHHNLSEYEILVLFKNNTMLKSCLRNIKTEYLWFLTAENEKPKSKCIDSTKKGWYIYNAHMIAPMSFWKVVCYSIQGEVLKATLKVSNQMVGPPKKILKAVSVPAVPTCCETTDEPLAVREVERVVFVPFEQDGKSFWKCGEKIYENVNGVPTLVNYVLPM